MKNNSPKANKQEELSEVSVAVEDDLVEETEVINKESEWKDKYVRALADYHNLEQRTNNQIVHSTFDTKKKLLLKFLTILDNIERAQIFVQDKGLILIKDDFNKMLKNEGIVEVDVLNKEYDPATAECIELVEGEKDNIMIEVLQKGHMLNDVLIRPAQVRVTKKTL